MTIILGETRVLNCNQAYISPPRLEICPQIFPVFPSTIFHFAVSKIFAFEFHKGVVFHRRDSTKKWLFVWGTNSAFELLADDS